MQMLAEGFHSLSGRSTEDSFSTLLPKAVDLEEADRETTNLLVFLLMQFLSRFVQYLVFTFIFITLLFVIPWCLPYFRSDQAHPTEDKQTLKTQELVLRHLFLLLGYNCVEKYFHISPHTLRYFFYEIDYIYRYLNSLRFFYSIAFSPGNRPSTMHSWRIFLRYWIRIMWWELVLLNLRCCYCR